MQSFSTFEAILELSKDGKKFIITNRKPNDKTEYIIEADRFKVNEIIEERQNEFRVKL